MFSVLVADDNYEDRELLKLEIQKALTGIEGSINFQEAASVRQAMEMLGAYPFDLLTLDIEFDKLTEGIDILPGLFDMHPSLNIIIVSGKLNKSEVTQELFRFTKDNVLKGKRWSRHFDVLDKKDNKTEAIKNGYNFATRNRDSASKVKTMLSIAEDYLEKGDYDKCIETYRKVQEIYPGEPESKENIKAFMKGGYREALEYLKKGEKIIAALLLGHHIESRLKAFTRARLGHAPQALSDCLRELEHARRIKPYKKSLFQGLLKMRNKFVHHPASLNLQEMDRAIKNIKLMDSDI